VWSVLGGIAHATERIRVGTGVTVADHGTHRAIVAREDAIESYRREVLPLLNEIDRAPPAAGAGRPGSLGSAGRKVDP